MGTSPYSEEAVGTFKVLWFSRGRKLSFGISVENLILSHAKAACGFGEIPPIASLCESSLIFLSERYGDR